MARYDFGNLTENRVLFSIGRDLELVPKQSGPPVNFFVYPYAESNHQPIAPEKITCRCEYRDREDQR